MNIGICFGVVILLFIIAALMKFAPQGYEDESGFHYSSPAAKRGCGKVRK